MILVDWKKTDPIEEDGEPGRLPSDEFGEREGGGSFWVVSHDDTYLAVECDSIFSCCSDF